MQHETHFIHMKQEAEAELPLKKQAFQDAKTTILGIEDELATIDRALEEARARKRRIAGTRQGYLTQKAADLANALLGGTPSACSELPATEDAHSLAEAETILQQRRGEIVQTQVFAKSKLRTVSNDVYHCLMRITAAEYELARESFFDKWCKVTALAELTQSGPIVDRERWEKIHIPSVTLNKDLRHVPSATPSGALNADSAGNLIYKHQTHARIELGE